MRFEVCDKSTCDNTKTLRGDPEFWTRKISRKEYELLFIVLPPGTGSLGARLKDDYFIVGNTFM